MNVSVGNGMSVCVCVLEGGRGGAAGWRGLQASELLCFEVLKAWTIPLLRNTVSQRALATGFSTNWQIKRPRVCRRTASMHEQIYFDIVAARVPLFRG